MREYGCKLKLTSFLITPFPDEFCVSRSLDREGTIQTVSLSFYRFDTAIDRLWAFAMMGLARASLRGIERIGFWKLCGSGTGEGFTWIPNTSVCAILATWPDLDTAQEQLGGARIFKRYRQRAAEACTLFLAPTSCRGFWSGDQPFRPEVALSAGPVAALTRATVQPFAALRFWGRVPDISAVIGADPNVLFKIGIGEFPLLNQVTFSIWPDTAAMASFARADGPHARAIRAVRQGGWFREELYARFQVLDAVGTWDGRSPLEGRELAA
jgi:spheroidene monooxygenase